MIKLKNGKSTLAITPSSQLIVRFRLFPFGNKLGLEIQDIKPINKELSLPFNL